MNQIINMIIRTVMRKMLNKGIDAGFNKAASMRGGGKQPQHPQGEIAQASKKCAPRAVQNAKVADREHSRPNRR